MRVIGLTGGSGAGKSLVSAWLSARGLAVINADLVYHELLDSEPALTAELAATFGETILDTKQKISRPALAQAVFGHANTKTLLHTLNKVTHKYVMREVCKRLEALEADGVTVAILDAPQLFEAKADSLCDTVIGVIAAHDLRVARVMTRDGLSQEAAQARIDAQKDDAFFLSRCDHILENNKDETALAKALDALLADMGVM